MSLEATTEAIGLPAALVRAVLNGEDAPVSAVVKVGGFCGLSVKEMFA